MTEQEFTIANSLMQRLKLARASLKRYEENANQFKGKRVALHFTAEESALFNYENSQKLIDFGLELRKLEVDEALQELLNFKTS